MAYDPATGQVVLFGGDVNGPLADTWILNGSTWTQASPPTSPPPRFDAAMAYDEATGQLLLFGGYGSGVLGDTWTWNGSTWTQISASSPPARFDASMAYDSAVSKLVLFGGATSPGSPLADTWTWNGSAWSEAPSVSSPPARYLASMAYDTSNGQLVLFGGYGFGLLGDTWIWDGATWSEQSGPGPGARYGAAVSFDPAANQLILIDGATDSGAFFADTWSWNGTTWGDLSPATSPPPRSAASMTYDVLTNQLVLFGGLDGANLGDTWIFSPAPPPPATWTSQFPPSTPSARRGAAIADDPGTGQLVLFGGSVYPSFIGDTWTWDGSSWTTTTPSTSPSPRGAASMAYDPGTGQLVLFGGNDQNNQTTLSDTWSWDGSNWTALNPSTVPPARRGAAMVYDPATQQFLMFGGFGNGGTVLDDTWLWDGKNWNLLTPSESPSARYNASIAFDATTGEVVLFGGTNGTQLADTWAWTGSTWTPMTTVTSPSARSNAGFASDASTGQLVLLGGTDSTGASLNDTWAWSGNAWSEVDPQSSPPARASASLAYDTTTSQLLVFGGQGALGWFADTWTYSMAGAPVPGTATESASQATVTFGPPTSNGGSPVTSYTVTATDLTTPANGGQSATGGASPITVTGLTNGDTYTFSITATNGVGTGPPSGFTNTVVPVTIPGPPVAKKATGGDSQAIVKFGPPTSNGGSPVTSYTVTATDLTTPANGGQSADRGGEPNYSDRTDQRRYLHLLDYRHQRRGDRAPFRLHQHGGAPRDHFDQPRQIRPRRDERGCHHHGFGIPARGNCSDFRDRDHNDLDDVCEFDRAHSRCFGSAQRRHRVS